ncbi:hypothetical protein WA577_003386 [Blastocystis sp. JDR]
MLPNDAGKIVVGVSGGPDSMALLHLMREWTSPTRLVAVTIDHGFRQESAEEAARVHQWVASMHIQHVVKKIDWACVALSPHHESFLPSSKPTQSQMEKEGRVQRYLLMSQLCREHSTRDVVVAHHGDDQIETFLMRLYRGSGYAGLACMKPVQEMDDGTRRIRPLLAASKDRLLATCKAAGIPFVIDPSNADLQYDRNRVRAAVAEIKAKETMDVARILRAATFFQEVRSSAEAVTQRRLQACCQYNAELGICRLDALALAAMPERDVLDILRTVCAGIGGAAVPSEKALRRVASTIRRERGLKKPMQVAGCVVCELKAGASVYAKKEKKGVWLCVCLDRNQLPQRCVDTHAVALPLGAPIAYIRQFTVAAEARPQSQSALRTIHPLPFITAPAESLRLSVSFLPDAMLQSFLCSNRGVLTRRNLSNTIARSIPAVFAEINGKKELVYSPVLKVNRVANVHFQMASVPKRAFRGVQPWVLY